MRQNQEWFGFVAFDSNCGRYVRKTKADQEAQMESLKDQIISSVLS